MLINILFQYIVKNLNILNILNVLKYEREAKRDTKILFLFLNIFDATLKSGFIYAFSVIMSSVIFFSMLQAGSQ